VDERLWLRRFHPAEPDSCQLVCFPHAGGAASFFFPVSRALSPTIEVVAVQYPGRQDRRGEPAMRDLTEHARLIYERVRLLARRPLAFFGHSMGASLAFEVARLLEQHDGVVLSALFVSGRRAPSRHRDERVHQKSDQVLIAELRRLDGTGAGLLDNEEVLQMIMPAIRADYTAAETYRCEPGPILRCPVAVHSGSSDPHVTREEAMAWQDHSTGTFTFHQYPGGHFFLTRHQEALLATLGAQLGSPAATM
jgi:pyochelin biosynthetic protein PchC